jgi:hypothetical protein
MSLRLFQIGISMLLFPTLALAESHGGNQLETALASLVCLAGGLVFGIVWLVVRNNIFAILSGLLLVISLVIIGPTILKETIGKSNESEKPLTRPISDRLLTISN